MTGSHRAVRERPPMSEDEFDGSRMHHVMARSAIRHPDAVAIEDGDRTCTYGELAELARRFAMHLRERGVRPGARVALVLPRRLETYAVLVGSLWAGAAFVPIDPGSPADRVAFVVDDADVAAVVVDTRTAPLARGLGVPVIDVDVDDWRASDPVTGSPADSPADLLTAPADDPDPAAYVIYTSGSSGRPKGVEITHRSATNFLAVVPTVYDVRPEDRVYQGMTLAFDFSIEEVWPTFAVGATLVVGPDDHRRLGPDLADFLERHRVSVLYCVPTLLATLPRDLPALRSVLVGGEACPRELVERWARSGRRMLNTYGPTEATVTATWAELRPGRPVTIGTALPTYSVLLLDEDLREVAPGEVGEIAIGGPGVARGYVGLPEKTADRFARSRVGVGCTARAISAGGPRTARSSTSAAPTTRSRSAGTGWIRARSRA